MNIKRFSKASYNQQCKMLASEQITDGFINECFPYLVQFLNYCFDYSAELYFVELFRRVCLQSADITAQDLKEVFTKMRRKVVLDQTNVLSIFYIEAAMDVIEPGVVEKLRLANYKEAAMAIFKTAFALLMEQNAQKTAGLFLTRCLSHIPLANYYLQLACCYSELQVCTLKLHASTLFGPRYDFEQLFTLLVKRLCSDVCREMDLQLEGFSAFGAAFTDACLQQVFDIYKGTANLDVSACLQFFNCVSLLLDQQLSVQTAKRSSFSSATPTSQIHDLFYEKYQAACTMLRTAQHSDLFTTLYGSNNKQFFTFLSDNLLLASVYAVYGLSARPNSLLFFSYTLQYVTELRFETQAARHAFLYVISQTILLICSYKNEYFNKGNIRLAKQYSTLHNSMLEKIFDRGLQADFLYVVLICVGRVGFRVPDDATEALVSELRHSYLERHDLSYMLYVRADVFKQLYEGYNMTGINIWNKALDEQYEEQYRNITEFNQLFFDVEQFGVYLICVFIMQLIDYFLLGGSAIERFSAYVIIGLLLTVWKLLEGITETSVCVLNEYIVKLYYLAPYNCREYFVLLYERIGRQYKNGKHCFCQQYIINVCNTYESLNDVYQLIAAMNLGSIEKESIEKMARCLRASAFKDTAELSYYKMIFYIAVLAQIHDEAETAHLFYKINRRYIAQVTQNLGHFENMVRDLLEVNHLRDYILTYMLYYLNIEFLYLYLEQEGIDFIPLFYAISRLIHQNRVYIKLTIDNISYIVYIYKKEKVGDLDYKQNRYLQNISQYNYEFVHAAFYLNACVNDDELWRIIQLRIDRKFKYLKQPDIFSKLQSNKAPKHIAPISSAAAICAYGESNILVFSGKLIYNIDVLEQRCFEVQACELCGEQLIVSVVRNFAPEAQYYRLNVHILRYINELVQCTDVLMRSQMIQQCVYAYKE